MMGNNAENLTKVVKEAWEEKQRITEENFNEVKEKSIELLTWVAKELVNNNAQGYNEKDMRMTTCTLEMISNLNEEFGITERQASLILIEFMCRYMFKEVR